MATEASIAARRQLAEARAEAAFTRILDRYGLAPPPKPAPVGQAPLAEVMHREWQGDVWELLLGAIGAADAEHAHAVGVDPALLTGTVAEIKAAAAELDDVATLKLLRSAEAGSDPPRKGVLAAFDRRIAELEAAEAADAEAEEAQGDEEPEA